MNHDSYVDKNLNFRSLQNIFPEWANVAILLFLFWLLNLTTGIEKISAASPPPSTWKEIPISKVKRSGDRKLLPDHFRILRLNLKALKRSLRTARDESISFVPGKTTSITLPLADGTFHKFAVTATPVMHPDLASAFPFIRTFTAQAIDDPLVTARIDYTFWGFHAMIWTHSGLIFIEPYSMGNTQDYICFEKKYSHRHENFTCEIDSLPGSPSPPVPNHSTLRTFGTQLRTYRIAIACTGEYATFYGGTTAGALSGIVTSLNRIDGIYEREVSVRMILIPNDTLIIFKNASTDPYTNGTPSSLLSQNQTTIDNIIGNANYDIGHVFGTGPGGIATLTVPCLNPSKARGATGLASPIGDVFDVDYACHEIGHQFGANHTFNSITGNCTSNRNGSTAFEPGSGNTIMSYSGICGADNIQPHSDAMFHTKSFDEILNFITMGSGNNCPVITASGNIAPVINAGPNYSVPYLTPFILTGSATDANGDPLTYSWEEYDLGPGGSPLSPSGNAPIFKVNPPDISPSRCFPKLSNVINNTQTIGEIFPSYARTMNFKFTARDNKIGGGGVTNNDTPVQVNVINTGTRFKVTSPNSVVTWQSGNTIAVTWDTAGTKSSPINCFNVNIRLSADGGITYPTLLAGNTANDGTQNILVPNIPTTHARVKVEAIGNIFFDLSDSDFTIMQANPGILSVHLEVFIEGFYTGGGTMNASIDPVNQPNNCDSLVLCLIAPVPPYQVQYRDTSILHVNGTVQFQFPDSISGSSFYLALHHRNAMETWSSVPVNISNNMNYDFTSGVTQAYGNNLIQLSDGNFAIWSGDTNQDGIIESLDYSDLENAIYLVQGGYTVYDLTGDLIVESTDYLIMEDNVYQLIGAAHP